SLKPVALREIVDTEQIPMPFLVQILQQLRTAGIVTSLRGSSGGYRLLRPAAEISLLEIVEAVCPGLIASELVVEVDSVAGSVVRDVWKQLAVQQRELLQQLTLTVLLEKTKFASEAMFYI
ncbi:MAG: HTH-type transcriptional regulator CymR, partial [Planctomycetota bacterium]